MKYSVIGTSWITAAFISAAKTVPGMELRGVYSRNLEKGTEFARQNEAEKVFTSLSDLARDEETESVYIASPNYLHTTHSELMLNSGKNVLVEKPAALSEEKYLSLTALAESKGLVYSEAIMSIHTPGFEIIRKTLPEAGDIRSAHFGYCQLSSKYPAFLRGEKPNIFNPDIKAGCLADIGIYNIYLAAGLFGMPEKILSSANIMSTGADCSGAAILKYPSFTLTLDYSKTGQNYSVSEITGDRGTVGIESVSQAQGITFDMKGCHKSLVPGDISRDDIMCHEAAYFLRMCNSKDYNDSEYLFSKETAIITRKIFDVIKIQCGLDFLTED